MAKEIQYINVRENPEALYYYMWKYDFLDYDAPKKMPEDFDELTWFDGDPDMIKVDDQVWYFDFSPADTNRTNICFYWAECDSEEETESIISMLKEFRERNLQMAEPNNWDTWHNMKNGIAYRGGSGYLYIIYLAPPKPIYTINLFDEISCEDLTPMKYSIDYESMDSAIDAAREAIADFPASEYSFVEATVFAGEYRDSFGNALGEPEAIYTISNLNEEETAREREKLGYCALEVDEYPPFDRNGKLIKVGSKVIWYDPDESVRDLKQVWSVWKINGDIVNISNDYSEAEVYPEELEIIEK